MRGIARFSIECPEWDSAPDFKSRTTEAVRYLYARAEPTLKPRESSVLELLRLGILVPAAEGAATLANFPFLLNPTLFMEKRANDGA